MARAEHANKAAKADIAAKVAARALVMMDPRSLNSVRAAADAQLQLARAAAANIETDGVVAVQAAKRDAKLMVEQVKAAEAAVKAAQLEGRVAVRAALNAQKAAKREVSLAKQRLNLARAAAKIKQSENRAVIQAAVDTLKVAQLDLEQASKHASWATKDLEAANVWTGVQVPADEVVFLPTLPVRVEQATVLIGDPANGPVLAVKQGRMTIDTSVPGAKARSLKKGMKVDITAIDGSAPGLAIQGIVDVIAPRPGTNGVDRHDVYLRVSVVEDAATPPEGASLRLTIRTGRSDEKSSPKPSKQSRVSPEPRRASSADPESAGSRQ
jgi:multidrug efflux pump subunit AcrA (membrane-fusion protein)